MDFNIAVLKGDGIGPEIMNAGRGCVVSIARKYSHVFNFQYGAFGAQAYFDHGHPYPEATRTLCLQADAVLKGPVGVDSKRMKQISPEFGIERAALLPLRRDLGAYANLRPVVLPRQFFDFSPLKPERLGKGLDILMIREGTGGNYFGKKVDGEDTGMQYAIDEGKYTREQVERIARFAFIEAMERRCKLTNVNKPNVMATGRFWNSIVDEVAMVYPEVEYEHMIVDNVAAQLSINPVQFNGVMLLENAHGDIITDQAGGILGSLGLMPSANFNPETRKGIYEPAHGSAPDIAGQNIANPYSMIGSVALMFERSFGLERESRDIWKGLENVFGEGYRTRDLTNSRTPKSRIVSTSEFGDLVAEDITSRPKIEF